MTRYSQFIFLCLLLAALMTSCSGDNEDREAGTVDQLTDRVAEKAVQNIRQPMEQAKQQVQAIQEAHMQSVNEAVDNTSH